jgi:TPR repeat protein
MGSSVCGWRIEAYLGAGRSAEVYRAVNAKTGRDGALKILTDRSAEMRRRFMMEIEAMREIGGSAIPALLAAGEADGAPFFVMEYLQAPFLPLDRPEAWNFARALAAAVADIHSRGWIHRDIKPANVLMRRNGDVVLIDFGLARRKDETERDDRRFGVGTPGFAAPEQLVEGKSDERSDVYSLGKMVRAAYGRRLPRRLAAVLHKATSDDPSERQRSALDFLLELEAAPRWHLAAVAGVVVALAAAVLAAVLALSGPSGGGHADNGGERRAAVFPASPPDLPESLEKQPGETDEDRFARLMTRAETGDSKAKMLVGECLFHGRGVATNLVESFKWYGRAAADGEPGAQATMGVMRLYGRGCERDPEAAATWFACAAEAGHAGAMSDLAFCYLNGIGVERDDYAGFAWAMLSAKRGNAAAQGMVGECYLGGRGTADDADKAREWLEKSASGGNKRARMLLDTYFGP